MECGPAHLGHWQAKVQYFDRDSLSAFGYLGNGFTVFACPHMVNCYLLTGP